MLIKMPLIRKRLVVFLLLENINLVIKLFITR